MGRRVSFPKVPKPLPGAAPPDYDEDREPLRLRIPDPDLLDALATVVSRLVTLDEHPRNAIALWTVATHCLDITVPDVERNERNERTRKSKFPYRTDWTKRIPVARVAPILAITSPQKRCGKTTVIDLLKRLVHRPLAASNVTPAALFRVVDQHNPTLLVDEADNSWQSRTSCVGSSTAGTPGRPPTFCGWCRAKHGASRRGARKRLP